MSTDALDITLPPSPIAEPDPITLAVRCACDIATGTIVDASATGIPIRGAWRDLSSKGNGGETYRRALSPGARWRFVSSEKLPRGTFLASDRKAVVRGDVLVGDLIADYERPLRQGTPQGEAKHDGKIGLVTGAADKGAKIEWLDVTRQKDGAWRAILPTGAHLTFPSPAWRRCRLRRRDRRGALPRLCDDGEGTIVGGSVLPRSPSRRTTSRGRLVVSTKVDLNALEHKATCSKQSTSLAWYSARRLSNGISCEDAVFIAANSPDVTLALIARIEELEAGYGSLVAECEERSENPEGDFYSEHKELLAKGTVLL